MNLFQSYTYSPSSLNIIISGYRIVGWDSLSIKRHTPNFKLIKGIRGKNTRIRDKSTAVEITLSIDQTSPAQAVLMDIASQDLSYGTGMLSVSLKNPHGSEVFFSAKAFLEGHSTIDMGGDLSKRDWTILCLDSDNYIGTDPISGLIGSITGGIF